MSGAPAELAWIAQAAAGSSQAFSQLVMLHQQAVRGFLRRLAGNRAEADDLAQEVFLAAWTQIKRYRREHGFRVWLCGIAYRKFLARKRGLFRRMRRELRSSDTAEAFFPAQHSDAWMDMQKAMAALPVDRRAVVALCLAADWSHSEAAAALGLPLGTVKSHIQHGRATLAEHLSAYERPIEMKSEAYERARK